MVHFIYMLDPGLLVIFLFFMILSIIVGSTLKSKFRKYSKTAMNYGMTGREVAEKMLRDRGITDVRVVSVKGQLSDHYNPKNKTVNLSPSVYNGNSISAAAVAAHESGHAIQHAEAYSMLQFRTALVPIQNVSATILNFIFFAMFFGAIALPGLVAWNTALIIIIACYSVFTLFAFITLPVEVNASNRALEWLESSGITSRETHPKAKDALRWAGYTYLVAALGALATLLYFLLMFLGGSSD